MNKHYELYLDYIKTNHDAALNNLVKSFIPLARYWANNYYIPNGDNDDLLQEALLGVLSGIKSFRLDKAAPEGFFSFVSMCVRRRVLTAVRLSNRRHEKVLNNAVSLDAPLSDETDKNLETLIPDGRYGPEEQVERREEYDSLMRFVASQLSTMEREILLQFADGYSYDEIAARTGRKKKAIDNALHRVRRKLSQAI